MNRKRRTEILIRGDRKVSKMIAEEIKQLCEVKIVNEPDNGLVMIKMRECAKKQLFYLGEVLVTEAKVYINENIGMGIVAGDDEELALNLAIIDAAYKADLNGIKKWNELLYEEEKKIDKKEKYESEKILKTKVNFSTMNI